MATNITWRPNLTHVERSKLINQRGLTIWLTGLSASGKSVIACALEQTLLHNGNNSYRLDGDNIRFRLNKDLGFSEKDKKENIRRIAEVARLFNDSCCIVITAFISPYKADRQMARDLHKRYYPEDEDPPFIEVYIDVPLAVAEQRDPKGLYKKARSGEIPDFPGIGASPYEVPESPDIHIRTDQVSVEDAVKLILNYLEKNGLITKKETQAN